MEQTLSSTPNPLSAALPEEGFVRLKQFVGPGKAIPVSTSTWWAWIKDGRAPKPIKLGPNVTAWNVRDIRAHIEEAAA